MRLSFISIIGCRGSRYLCNITVFSCHFWEKWKTPQCLNVNVSPETISLTTSCGFVVPASEEVNLCSAALWSIKYNKQLINHIISAFASHCFLHFRHKCTMAAGHLAAINFTQSGSKKGRQQSGEWRNKEWGSQLCHAILARLSLSLSSCDSRCLSPLLTLSGAVSVMYDHHHWT